VAGTDGVTLAGHCRDVKGSADIFRIASSGTQSVPFPTSYRSVITEPVVQSIGSLLPKLEATSHNGEPTPTLRARNVAAIEFPARPGDAILQLGTVSQATALT
jgi:hypothetical protein